MPASMCVSPLARVDAPGMRSKGKNIYNGTYCSAPRARLSFLDPHGRLWLGVCLRPEGSHELVDLVQVVVCGHLDKAAIPKVLLILMDDLQPTFCAELLGKFSNLRKLLAERA